MEYSKEQRELIEAAFMAGQADTGVDPSYSNAQRYVDELEKPKPVFELGEVYAYSVSGDSFQYFSHHSESELRGNERHLNLTENPSTALAIERLERLASDKEEFAPNGMWKAECDAMEEFAQQAIDDIKKMVG